jgi:lipopolysaccharide biosynthesis regulator YciM
MRDSLIVILPLLALLLGLTIGKAHERYKLHDGRWFDRRRLRETPHYMLGLNSLADNRVDQALDELTRAVSAGNDALELHLVLGNLYREKGQVGRAINVHEALLQRPDLTPVEHAYVLLCLGLDFRHGGFVDRALEAFSEVLRLDPRNRYALRNLQKLHEEQHQWEQALAVRERLDAEPGGGQIQGFLRNAMGEAQAADGRLDEAARTFAGAVEADVHTLPAHVNLGDVRERLGDVPAAVRAWEHVVDVAPERAYLVFERLRRAYQRLGRPATFAALCERLFAADEKDWRARLALARHLQSEDRHREAFDLLLDALPHNPHGLALHQAVWQALSSLNLDHGLVARYVDLARDAVFYLDPHVCVRCRYRSTELLWQCPQCHEWNTFVEERIAPAREGDADDASATATASERG